MAGCSKKQYAIMMSAGDEGKKLASEMGGMEQDKFNEATNDTETTYWLADGVHPTPAGHNLIAKALSDEFEKIK